MGLDLTPRCAKCGKVLEVTAMKALPDGKKFVCTSCYEHASTPNSPFTVNKERLRPLPTESIRTVDKEDFVAKGDDIFNQKEYVCNSCGYQFKRGSGSVVGVCPYCGKREVRQKVEQSAGLYLDDD